MDSSRILLIDIETSPLISYTWGLYEQNVIERISTFTILSVAYKWIGKPTKVIACDVKPEFELLTSLHKLLSQAQIVVAHNGDSFDIKKINTRFIIHKISPPSPYITIDTKKVAKNCAAFDSNSLNNLGIDMGEGEKIKHRGFDMWKGCMAGNKHDWNDMKRYNKQDVDLLEKIYLRLRPWMRNHPNLANNEACPKCQSTEFQSRGIGFYGTGSAYRRYQCNKCHGWFRSTISEKRSVVKNG